MSAFRDYSELAAEPTVLAECRPNLRACNFFVRNFPKTDAPSVEIDENTISVRISDRAVVINLPPALTLVPGSVPVVQKNYECFTFRAMIKDFSPSAPSEKPGFHPDLVVGDSVSVKCGFCGEVLTEDRAFSRVLPLPSSEEPSDFFCHRHHDDVVSLDPRPSDFFFNYFFYKIHSDNFTTPLNGDKFTCPKCLELLGEVRGKCVKLWSSLVSFSSEPIGRSLIETFLNCFKHFIKNLPTPMNKFVFTCSDGSSSRYTLLRIMDRTLTILESHKLPLDLNGSDFIHLDHKKVMKVLFSHHEQLTESTKEWMKSFNTSVIPIHPKIEEKFLTYLKNSSSKIPLDYAFVDGMGVSYLNA